MATLLAAGLASTAMAAYTNTSPWPLPHIAEVNDRLCGGTTVGPLAWVDMPVYWINVDSAQTRAERMRSQLAQVLTPGTCATRVPAVLVADVPKVLNSTLLLLKDSSRMRFRGTENGQLEYAIQSSHLRAIYAGWLDNPNPETVFLVLEDDVDLLFFPRVAFARPDLLNTRRTLSTLAKALPDDWRFLMLMIITNPKVFYDFHAIWKKEGGKVLALNAERTTHKPCYNRLYSAGAYLVRGLAAQGLQSIWPVTPDETSPAGMRITVERTCWYQPLVRQWCMPYRVDKAPEPVFVSDTCMLHMDSWGPVMTLDEAVTAYRHSDMLSMRAKSDIVTYAATPPLVRAYHLDTSDMAHAEHIRVHNYSYVASHEWWSTNVLPPIPPAQYK